MPPMRILLHGHARCVPALGSRRTGGYDWGMPRPPKKFGRPSKPGGMRAGGSHAGKPPRPRKPPAVAPRVAAPGEPAGSERLQKVLAAAGIASRRECEQFIIEGRVEVDGEVVSELGAKVDRQRQEIRVDGEPLARPKLQYFAVNKPTGVVSTARDPAGRPRVIDLLPPGVGRMFNVGRLDLTSEGLILVTNDGELANRLTHPRHGVEKIYEVTVAGQPEPDVLAQLQRGVHLAEGYVRAVNVRVKSRKKNSTLLEMVLDEGRNREIRRLLARVGHKVQRLLRIAIGPIRLGELPRGAVRPLTREEIQKLRAAADPDKRPVLKKAAPARVAPTGGGDRKAVLAQRDRKRSAARGKAGIGRSPAIRKPGGEDDAAVGGRRIIGDDAPAAQPPAKPKATPHAKVRPRKGRGRPQPRSGKP
jgi:23S rRNA pseudouridine2605 synthase